MSSRMKTGNRIKGLVLGTIIAGVGTLWWSSHSKKKRLRDHLHSRGTFIYVEMNKWNILHWVTGSTLGSGLNWGLFDGSCLPKQLWQSLNVAFVLPPRQGQLW